MNNYVNLHSIAQYVNEAIICLSPNLKVLALNSVAEKIFDPKQERSMNLDINAFFTHARWSTFRSSHLNQLKANQMPLQPIEIKRGNERILWIVTHSVSEKEQPTGFVLIGHYHNTKSMQKRKLHSAAPTHTIDQFFLQTFHKGVASQEFDSTLEYGRNVYEYMAKIIAAMPGSVYWMNRKGIYLGCNDNMAKLFNLKNREDIVGKTYKDLYDERTARHYKKSDEKVMRTGESLLVEEPLYYPGKEKEIYLSNKVPLRDKTEHVIGMLGISLNITARKKMEKNLKEAKEKAEVANHAKTEFIANMSHDIRTPLNGVIGVAELLKKTAASKQDQEFGEMIYVAGQQLLDLLNDVLDVIKVDHVNENDICKETFSLPDLLRNLCSLMETSTQAKGLKLNLKLDPKIPKFVETDRLKIQRILQNIMGNAIKFTHQGHIDLRAELLSKDLRSVHVRFCVIDTGIGISKDQQQNIFERFFRATPSYQGVYQGHGIGLYIVKKFVELLGGKIEVRSEVGEGTQMCFSLEMKVGRFKDIKKNYQPVQSKISKDFKIKPFQTKKKVEQLSKNSLKILFIEDNPIVLKTGQTLLQSADCLVQVADNAEVAIGLFKNQKFDLVISDLGLPGIQGDEMTSLLRYWEKVYQKKPVPIVAVTAHADEEIKANCLQAGINKVYLKPLDNTLAKNIISEWLKPKKICKVKSLIQKKKAEIKKTTTSGLGRDLPNTEEELFQLEQYPLLSEKEGIEKLGSKSALREGLEITLNQMLSEEMTNIEKSYLAGDWENVQRIAHKLKGSSLYCGTVKMTYACQYLERYWKAGYRDQLEALYRQMLSVFEQTKQAVQVWLDKNSK